MMMTSNDDRSSHFYFLGIEKKTLDLFIKKIIISFDLFTVLKKVFYTIFK